MSKKLPIFKSTAGYSKFEAAYDTALQLWRVPHEGLDLKTRFGSTHINVCGPSDGYPLVLLHGAGLSSVVWYPNISELSAQYRVYAVDCIGDAGKSVVDRLLKKRSDYADWLREVFDGLGIKQAYLLGHSYGGWLALNMALTYPQRVGRLILLAPAASLFPLSFMTMLFLKLGEVNIRPPARSIFNMLKSKGTVLEEAFIHHMEMINRYCRPVTISPDVYSDDELRQIYMPTLLLIGAIDKIYNPQKAMRRARQLIPNITGEIIQGLGHILFMVIYWLD